MSDFINTIDALGDDVVIDSIIDRTITEFKDDKITTVGSYAFSGCAALKTVDIPNTTVINDKGFSDCASLETINSPSVITANRSVFNGCSSLVEINLPNISTITSESASGSGFLAYCTSLRKADFTNLTKIGGRAFMSCTSLVILIIRNGTVCALAAANVITNSPINKGTGYIYVPRALVDSYKAATNWSTYADQFRALEDYTVDGTTTGELDETKI